MTTLTIRLDPKLEKALDRIAKRTGRTKSEIARDALRRQIAVARFRELRSKTLPFAEAQGLVTDEDVFRASREGFPRHERAGQRVRLARIARGPSRAGPAGGSRPRVRSCHSASAAARRLLMVRPATR